MLEKIKSDIIGLSMSTLFVWSTIIILYFNGQNPLKITILIVSAIILPILLLVNISAYKNRLEFEKRNKNNNDNNIQ